MNKYKMKKVLLLSLLILLCSVFFTDEDVINYLSINQFSLISISLTSLDTRDVYNNSNLPLQQVLINLFVESIFRDYIKEELPSFKVITNILSKPFTSFWIINEIMRFIFKKIDYLVQQIKKYFVYVIKLLFTLSLPLTFLFYIKTHLKTYRFAPIVLRC
jgi:hypothetical protein